MNRTERGCRAALRRGLSPSHLLKRRGRERGVQHSSIRGPIWGPVGKFDAAFSGISSKATNQPKNANSRHVPRGRSIAKAQGCSVFGTTLGAPPYQIPTLKRLSPLSQRFPSPIFGRCNERQSNLDCLMRLALQLSEVSRSSPLVLELSSSL
jgi:hypothetical protein